MNNLHDHQPSKLGSLFALALIVICIALPRSLVLNRYATPDEPLWLMRSANFFEALVQGHFADTYQKVHPGVTTMWAGAIGYLLEFPDYVKYGPGQQANTIHLYRYLDKVNGPEPLDLLVAGRIIIVIGIVITLSLAYLTARKLLGFWPATIGFLLIAFDPFSIGLSRLLHTDGLMSAFLFLSLLAFFSYLYRGRRLFDLLLSAVAAGLAWLTKSPALFLIPFFALLELWELARRWRSQGRLTRRDLWLAARSLLVWGGLGLVVLWLLWPALWVNPIESIRGVLTGASEYAAEGHVNPLYYNGQVYPAIIPDWSFYPVNYLWRATPLTLIGLLLSGLVFASNRKSDGGKNWNKMIIPLTVFSILFAVFISLSGKKFDRYLLPAFPPLNLVAGMGWWTAVVLLLKWSGQGSGFRLTGIIAAWAVLGLVSLAQFASMSQTYPYYLDYYNPVLGGPTRAGNVMMLGWGEGLDQAANYINQVEDANRLKVLAWYGDGPFSYFFSGTTLDQDLPQDPAEIPPADYLVLYVHEWQRKLPSPEFLDYFTRQEPVHVVTINQIEYARIYRLRN
jgi:hypothetical protein